MSFIYVMFWIWIGDIVKTMHRVLYISIFNVINFFTSKCIMKKEICASIRPLVMCFLSIYIVLIGKKKKSINLAQFISISIFYIWEYNIWIRLNFQENSEVRLLFWLSTIFWFAFAFLFVFVLNFGRTCFAFYGTKLFLWLPYSLIVISVICDGAQNPKAKSNTSKNSSMQDFCRS